MRQKKGTFFSNLSLLITGRVVLHKKFYKKISSTSYQKMEDYLGKKNFFWVAGFIILGVKKNEHFFDWFQSKKWKNYLLIQKDNSLTFYATKKKGTFFKICHFLITGRVVLHNKFYKKISSTSYQKWKERQKNFFLVAGFIILGVKKNEHFFDWFQSKKWRIIF